MTSEKKETQVKKEKQNESVDYIPFKKEVVVNPIPKMDPPNPVKKPQFKK